jgi:hypothetical protein
MLRRLRNRARIALKQWRLRRAWGALARADERYSERRSPSSLDVYRDALRERNRALHDLNRQLTICEDEEL